MELTSRQKEILNGMILGDAYLQKTGRNNARLRLEHSYKQKAYMDWKYSELEHIFQSEPLFIERVHPLSNRTYQYLRLQSYASLFLGTMRQKFYSDQGKMLPKELDEVLKSSLTIAVWYMDDGYYDARDKSAHIYLQALESEEIQRLITALRQQHGIRCKAYSRPDRKACQLNFRSADKDKLLALVAPHCVPTMSYKIPLTP